MEDHTSKFEGPEKKLEIILFNPQPELRSGGDWGKVAGAARARIIGKRETARLDAYLLSESSLFVWDCCILMITCGRTSPISALDEILKIVDRDNVAFVFYERKNFMFPDDQQSDFEVDAARMAGYFPGKSYRLGPANHDHLHVFYWAHENAFPEPDATLQVLMNDLDPGVMELFGTDAGSDSDETGVRSGLYQLYPDSPIVDSFGFSPYGYSMNGILGEKYFTVHVTPQEIGSYTSFETNVIEDDYSKIIRDVVSIFKPAKFSVVLTTSLEDRFMSLHVSAANVVEGYRVSEKSMYEFDCGYKITFLNYRAFNS